MHPRARPHDLDPFQDAIRREAERVGTDLSRFMMIGLVGVRITSADDPSLKREVRPICEGTAEMVLSDLEAFAAAGYSLVVTLQDCRDTRSAAELADRLEEFGREVIPLAKSFKPGGEWMPVPA